MMKINVRDNAGNTTTIERPIRTIAGQQVIRRKGAWRVVTPDGKGGFVCDLATPALAAPSAAPVAAAAKVSVKGSLAGLQSGLRLLTAKLAKNPACEETKASIAKVERKIAAFTSGATAAAAPAAPAVNDEAALTAIRSILDASPALAAKVRIAV